MSAAAAAAAASNAGESGVSVEQLLSQRRFADLHSLAQAKELEDSGESPAETELWCCVHLFAAALNQQL